MTPQRGAHRPIFLSKFIHWSGARLREPRFDSALRVAATHFLQRFVDGADSADSAARRVKRYPTRQAPERLCRVAHADP